MTNTPRYLLSLFHLVLHFVDPKVFATAGRGVSRFSITASGVSRPPYPVCPSHYTKREPYFSFALSPLTGQSKGDRRESTSKTKQRNGHFFSNEPKRPTNNGASKPVLCLGPGQDAQNRVETRAPNLRGVARMDGLVIFFSC